MRQRVVSGRGRGQVYRIHNPNHNPTLILNPSLLALALALALGLAPAPALALALALVLSPALALALVVVVAVPPALALALAVVIPYVARRPYYWTRVEIKWDMPGGACGMMRANEALG